MQLKQMGNSSKTETRTGFLYIFFFHSHYIKANLTQKYMADIYQIQKSNIKSQQQHKNEKCNANKLNKPTKAHESKRVVKLYLSPTPERRSGFFTAPQMFYSWSSSCVDK